MFFINYFNEREYLFEGEEIFDEIIDLLIETNNQIIEEGKFIKSTVDDILNQMTEYKFEIETVYGK
jgi:hypothetical protein